MVNTPFSCFVTFKSPCMESSYKIKEMCNLLNRKEYQDLKTIREVKNVNIIFQTSVKLLNANFKRGKCNYSHLLLS